MTLFADIGRMLGNIDPSRFLAAQAILNGNPGEAARIRALAAESERERAEAEREARARDTQIASGKNLGYSGDELAVLSGSDLSQNYRQRIDPYQLAPGSRRYVPGADGGRSEQMTEAPNPTNDQRTYEWLQRIDPDLAESYAAKQALIINSGIDPATGQPYSQALDPRELFDFRRGSEAPSSTPPISSDPRNLPPPTAPRLNGAPAGPPATAPRIFDYSPVPGDTETSGYRDPEHNRRVGGVPNSYHTRRGEDGRPMATDRTPPAGMSMESYYAELRRRNPGLDVINEGDHVHMEPRGRPPANAPRRSASSSTPPRVATPDQAARLRPGQLYRAPNGSLRRRSR